MAGNAYDEVAYPSGVFATTHPDHLATVARLHGLTPPDPATARVLELGGGDGMNVIAMADALPGAAFLSLDLAERHVARGRAIVAAAGLANVRVAVGDIVAAADALQGPFDYVIAHGVYAWVPPLVQEALLRLIGRVLAPHGVAFVSYNALPGAYYKRIVREMVLHEVGGIADANQRMHAARDVLAAFAQPRDDDPPTLAVVRGVAGSMAGKAPALLLHDELAETYAPHAFRDVVAAAAPHGLRFLNEAEPFRLDEGMPETPLDEAALIRAVQSRDYRTMCFFHQTLFVRETCAPLRSPALDAVRELFLSAQCVRAGPTEFRSSAGTFAISDAALAEAVAHAAAMFPQRPRVGDLIDDELRLAAIYRLFRGTAIELHAMPLPGTTTPGARPRASNLARALVGMGEDRIFTLEHRPILLADPGPRAFLALLDGSRDRAALAADWAASGFAAEASVDAALARFAALPLMVE